MAKKVPLTTDDLELARTALMALLEADYRVLNDMSSTAPLEARRAYNLRTVEATRLHTKLTSLADEAKVDAMFEGDQS